MITKIGLCPPVEVFSVERRAQLKNIITIPLGKVIMGEPEKKCLGRSIQNRNVFRFSHKGKGLSEGRGRSSRGLPEPF